MRITIDTKADSLEELKHVMLLLQSVVGDKTYTNYQPPPAQETYSPMSIFSDNPPSQPSMQTVPQTQTYPTQQPAPAQSYDVFNLFSGSTAATPGGQPKPSSDDLLKEISNGDEERIDDDRPDDSYEIIPY